MDIMKVEEPPGCDCGDCRSMCNYTGWGSPEEIFELMAQGYGPRLMLDYWGTDGDLPFTEIVCPARAGREGRACGHTRRGQCVFQGPTGHCELYGKAGRPAECRLAHCD